MLEEYYYQTHGIEFGPVTRSAMVEMIRGRVLVIGDRYRIHPGPWRDLAEFPAVPAAQSSPSHGVPVNSQPAPEVAPWAYLTSIGIVGPLTTGQLLDAVQSGRVSRKTLIRLQQSPDWIAAEQIEGLVFPQGRTINGGEEGLLAPRAAGPRVVPNADMRHLFAECVLRQKKSQPLPASQGSSRASDGIGAKVGGVIGSAATGVTGRVAGVLEGLVAFVLALMRSRITWGVAVILVVAMTYPRVAGYLTTQGQTYSTLLSTSQEIARLRDAQVDEPTWEEFRRHASAELAQLVPALEWRSDTNDKASMSLLWLARDYLPAELRAGRALDPATQSKVEQHLAIVQQELWQSRDAVQHWDLLSTVIVGADVIGVVAAIVYFARKR